MPKKSVQDLLEAEYSTNAAQQAQERERQQPKRYVVGQPPVKNGKQKHAKAPAVHIPLGTREEVVDAVKMLLGENSGIKVSSINGGKAKAKKKRR